jgi:hypothetical protein
VRLNADELAKVEAAANASNQSVSKWMRSALFAALQA